MATIDAPAAALAGIQLLTGNGSLAAGEGLARLAEEPHLLCHGAFLAERLGLAAEAPRQAVRAARQQRHFDVAELFAFV